MAARCCDAPKNCEEGVGELGCDGPDDFRRKLGWMQPNSLILQCIGHLRINTPRMAKARPEPGLGGRGRKPRVSCAAQRRPPPPPPPKMLSSASRLTNTLYRSR